MGAVTYTGEPEAKSSVMLILTFAVMVRRELRDGAELRVGDDEK